MVPTTFGRELLGRDVVDASNDKLGTMADFCVDMDTGSIVSLLVVIDQGIDPKFLLGLPLKDYFLYLFLRLPK